MLDRTQLLKIAVFGEAEYFPDYMLELDPEHQNLDLDDWYTAIARKYKIKFKDAQECSDTCLKHSIMGKTAYIPGAYEEYARRRGINVLYAYPYEPAYNIYTIAQVLENLGFNVTI